MTALGERSSDVPLMLAERPLPAAGTELDLSGRTSVRLDLPDGEPVHLVACGHRCCRPTRSGPER